MFMCDDIYLGFLKLVIFDLLIRNKSKGKHKYNFRYVYLFHNLK